MAGSRAAAGRRVGLGIVMAVLVASVVPSLGSPTAVPPEVQRFYDEFVRPFAPDARPPSEGRIASVHEYVPLGSVLSLHWDGQNISATIGPLDAPAPEADGPSHTAYCFDTLSGSYYDTPNAESGINVAPGSSCAPKPGPATIGNPASFGPYTKHNGPINMWEYVVGGYGFNFFVPGLVATASASGGAVDIPSSSYFGVICTSSGSLVNSVASVVTPVMSLNCIVIIVGQSPLVYTQWVGGGQNAFPVQFSGFGVVGIVIHRLV